MIKPFGVKKTDWTEFNKALLGKMGELQLKHNTIKEIKYSSIMLKPEISDIGDSLIEYSAIILYDDNEE